ncbi:hypothetical protein EYC80_004358 [Monilinia laxa]|uniref:Uncharacterized protein n=1 Tax=Monilinia laxa TaxID=61186 RepID=A0A5N6KN53_MONLA|nr:hypothetical protein EYC80_004358 [Monilinia laxa]
MKFPIEQLHKHLHHHVSITSTNQEEKADRQHERSVNSFLDKNSIRYAMLQDPQYPQTPCILFLILKFIKVWAHDRPSSRRYWKTDVVLPESRDL